MPSLSNKPDNRVMPQVIEALHRLQAEPGQLDRERYERYSERRLTYSEAGTTKPTSPKTPEVDVYQESLRRGYAHERSEVTVQFKRQWEREYRRIEWQRVNRDVGRRQTLPYDETLDYKANSQNNVRSRWVEQGIWGDEWGPAWPKDSHPSDRRWLEAHSNGLKGPFRGAYDLRKTLALRWGHEKSDPDPEPEPAPEQVDLSTLFETEAILADMEREEERARNRERRHPLYIIRAATVRDPEASRPYHQFMWQVAREREWIKDDMDFLAPGKAIDVEEMAFQSVKRNWVHDKIWNPRWGEVPGMVWVHEEPIADVHEDLIRPSNISSPVNVGIALPVYRKYKPMPIPKSASSSSSPAPVSVPNSVLNSPTLPSANQVIFDTTTGLQLPPPGQAEKAFWESIMDAARKRGMTLSLAPAAATEGGSQDLGESSTRRSAFSRLLSPFYRSAAKEPEEGEEEPPTQDTIRRTRTGRVTKKNTTTNKNNVRGHGAATTTRRRTAATRLRSVKKQQLTTAAADEPPEPYATTQTVLFEEEEADENMSDETDDGGDDDTTPQERQPPRRSQRLAQMVPKPKSLRGAEVEDSPPTTPPPRPRRRQQQQTIVVNTAGKSGSSGPRNGGTSRTKMKTKTKTAVSKVAKPRGVVKSQPRKSGRKARG